MVDATFEGMDPDGSGKIEYNELNKMLRRGGTVTLAADLQDGAQGNIEVKAMNKSTRELLGADGGAAGKAGGKGGKGGVSMAPSVKQRGGMGPPPSKSPPGRNLKRDATMLQITLDLESEATIQEQLRDALSANAMRVIDLFREWDDDESGYVDKKEFCRAMRQLGITKEQAKKSDIDMLFDSCDPDG